MSQTPKGDSNVNRAKTPTTKAADNPEKIGLEKFISKVFYLRYT